jgi:hypothetical protein
MTKIPVLSEKSALSIFGRVLSGKRKVRIGEIGRLPLYSAALGEHIVHRAEPICAPSASRLRSTSILYTEPVHRAEPICAPSGAEVHTDRVSASLDEHIVHRTRLGFARRAYCTPSGAEVSVLLFFNQCIHKCNDFCNLLFRQIQFFRR